MTIEWKLVVSCETLDFNHALSKTCQNATMDEKVYKDLKYVFIKSKRGLSKLYNLTKEIWEKEWKIEQVLILVFT